MLWLTVLFDALVSDQHSSKQPFNLHRTPFAFVHLTVRTRKLWKENRLFSSIQAQIFNQITCPQGMFMMLRIAKKFLSKIFDFCKILKILEKNMIKSAKYFCYCFIWYKEKVLTDSATVKSWNRRYFYLRFYKSYVTLGWLNSFKSLHFTPYCKIWLNRQSLH